MNEFDRQEPSVWDEEKEGRGESQKGSFLDRMKART